MKLDDCLILIKAESLSPGDEFMQHRPRTKREEEVKALIWEAITKRVKNFYRPMYDPSFTADGSAVCFEPGKMPAVGKSYNDWIDLAKLCHPSRNSRLGTRLEYGAFLGVLIKSLVYESKSLEWAWNAVCNNSRELGHYWNNKDAKRQYEMTGSRSICRFCDLANTRKILAPDDEIDGFWLAGGEYRDFSEDNPLAFIKFCSYCNSEGDHSTGWVVFS